MQTPQPPEAGGSSIPKAAWIAMSAIGGLIVVLLAAVLYKLSVPASQTAPAPSAASASAPMAGASAQRPGQSAVAVTGASPSRSPAASFPALESTPHRTTSRTTATRRESGSTAPTRTATSSTRADGQAQNFQPQTFPAQAPAAQPQAPTCHDCGTVASVTPVQEQGQANGVGAVVGGLVGGLLGNQVGGGNGRTAATVIGAVGGGLAGNEVQKRINTHTAYRVQIRMDDGSERSITLSNAPPAGQRVRVNPDGSLSPL